MDRCPNCHYSLRGLPDVHQCPECAFAYERDATVVRPDCRFCWWLVGASGVLTLAGIALFIWQGSPPFLLVWAVWFAGAIWRIKQARAFVVVSQTSVRICSGTGREERYSTTDIRDATWSFVNGAIVIHALDGSKLTAIPSKVLWSTSRAKHAARTITAYAERARERAVNTGDHSAK